MRLKADQAHFINQVAKNIFGEGSSVYLFGSRTNDDRRGGDIDLYIEPTEQENMVQKKIKMLKALYKELGEQKIDIVLNNPNIDLYIYKVAKEEGVLL